MKIFIYLFISHIVVSTGIMAQNAAHPTLEFISVLETDVNDLNSNYFSESDSVLDSNGNLIVTGYFNGTIDMDPSSDDNVLVAKPMPPQGGHPLSLLSSYIGKYDPSGNLVWAYKIGDDSNIVFVRSVTTDENNNIIVSGKYRYSVDYDLYDSQEILHTDNFRDFVVSYDENAKLNWVNEIDANTSLITGVRDLAVKKNGYVVVAGTLLGGSIIFPTSSGGIELIASSQTHHDSYLAEINISGDWVTARSIQSQSDLKISSIIIDSKDNVICNIRELGPVGSNLPRSKIVRKYYSNSFDYDDILKLEPAEDVSIGSFDLDQDDQLYLGGSFDGDIYENGSIFLTPSIQGATDGYLIKFDTKDKIDWVNTLTPAHNPRNHNININNIKVDNNNRLMFAGGMKGQYRLGNGVGLSSDIDSTAFNSYVARFDQQGNAIWASVIQGYPRTARVTSLHLHNQDFYIYGKLVGLTDFDLDPLNNSNTDVVYDDPDAYMVKYTDN